MLQIEKGPERMRRQPIDLLFHGDEPRSDRDTNQAVTGVRALP